MINLAEQIHEKLVQGVWQLSQPHGNFIRVIETGRQAEDYIRAAHHPLNYYHLIVHLPEELFNELIGNVPSGPVPAAAAPSDSYAQECRGCGCKIHKNQSTGLCTDCYVAENP